MKFRKKPDEIEAVQFTGKHSLVDIIEMLGAQDHAWYYSEDHNTLKMPHGKTYVLANKGDWIIKDGTKFYSCSKQAFGLLYEPVTCSNPCAICGKEMVQVDLDLWKCPNYPHSGDECADDFVFSSKEPSTSKHCLETGCKKCEHCEAGPTSSKFKKGCYFYETINKKQPAEEPTTVDPSATSDLYCVGCGKPKVLCLGGTTGCNG